MNWGCICFDLDNTLLNYEIAFEKGMYTTYHHFFEGAWIDKKKMEANEWFPVFKHLCNELWNDVRTKKYSRMEYRKKRFIQSLHYFGITADAEMAMEFQNYFYSVVHQFVEPMEGVQSLLDELKRRHITIGIISNGRTSIQQKKIIRAGLDNWFARHNVFISEQYNVAKPEPLIFHIANEKLNNTSDPSLFVGDSWELDIIGSVNAGWDAIFFNSRKEKPTTNHQPIGTCGSIKELIKLLEI